MQEIGGQVRETIGQAPRQMGAGVREAAFVLLGAADLCREGIGDLASALANGPRTLRAAVRHAPARVRSVVEELHDRGRGVIHHVERRPAVQEAEERVHQAVRGAKAATTSARRAAVSGVEAARDVATMALRDEGAAPYEEWTYAELYELATARDIEGRSTMLKDDLIAALRRR